MFDSSDSMVIQRKPANTGLVRRGKLEMLAGNGMLNACLQGPDATRRQGTFRLALKSDWVGLGEVMQACFISCTSCILLRRQKAKLEA